MKNKLFFALVAAAGLLAGCSSSDDAVVGQTVQEPTDDRVPINFRTSLVATRGTGTVGGLQGAADNVWAGQTFPVYMLDKGTLIPSVDKLTGDPLLKDVTFTTPNVLAGVSADVTAKDATVTNNGMNVTEQVHYYPQDGAYDFWAYRVDDAAFTLDEATMKGTFTIDGSQDIMTARAVPFGIDRNLDGTWPAPNPKTPGESVTEDYIFSSYAARRGIDPLFKFKHELTRLTFVITGNEASLCAVSTDPENVPATPNTEAVFVTAIKVESFNTGTLTVAYLGAAEQEQIEINQAVAPVYLSLKERDDTKLNKVNSPLRALTRTAPIWNTTTDKAYETPIGEALLVAPQTKYNVTIEMEQKIADQNIIEYFTVCITEPVSGTKYFFKDKNVDGYDYYTAWVAADNPTSGPVYDNFYAWVTTGKTAADGVITKADDGAESDEILQVVYPAEPKKFSKDIELTLANGDAFEKGKSYVVKINLYGNEKISFHTDLTGWQDGGTISRDTDQD